MPGLRRDVHEFVFAAPFGGHDALFHQLLADALRVGLFLVHLVHGHDDRDARGLGVVQRLDGLRHDPVVRRHHQDRDVGDLGATGPHGGEGLVARGVDEGDSLPS